MRWLTLIPLGTEKVLVALYQSQDKFRELLKAFFFIKGRILIATERVLTSIIEERTPRAKNKTSELANLKAN